jgi:hypothetical protein
MLYAGTWTAPGSKKPDEEKLLASEGASLWGGMSMSGGGVYEIYGNGFFCA